MRTFLGIILCAAAGVAGHLYLNHQLPAGYQIPAIIVAAVGLVLLFTPHRSESLVDGGHSDEKDDDNYEVIFEENGVYHVEDQRDIPWSETLAQFVKEHQELRITAMTVVQVEYEGQYLVIVTEKR